MFSLCNVITFVTNRRIKERKLRMGANATLHRILRRISHLWNKRCLKRC